MRLNHAGDLVLQYEHPFTLAGLADMDVNLISEELARLQKSISLLRQTNNMLHAACLDHHLPSSLSSSTSTSQISSSATGKTHATTIDGLSDVSPEEAEEFQEIIADNDIVIRKQLERVDMCKFALRKKIGFDPTNTHYDLDGDTTAMVIRPLDNTDSPDHDRPDHPESTVAPNDEQGLLL